MFKFIDLFCGLGGFRIALEQNGGTCVYSCDNNKEVAKIYQENFGDNPLSDITELDPSTLPEYDVLCAGFPCQPFSLAGKRLGFMDSRGTLFFEVARIIKETNPKVVFLENVSGIVNHDKGNTITVILDILKSLNYDCYWKVMNAKDYGIPQNRSRWYCIGIRNDLDDGKFEFPQKQELEYTLEDIIEKTVFNAYSATEIAIKNINKKLDDFKKSGRYNKNNLIIANEIRASKCNFRCDGISPCLTAKMGTGGNNIPVIVDYGRKITEKEALKIMGFPENYKIKYNCMESYRQIGNSVVVPIIQKISKQFLRYLN